MTATARLPLATGDPVRIVAGAYRGRRGTVALAAYQPAAILVRVDGCPVVLAFGRSELAAVVDHRGRGPIDAPAELRRADTLEDPCPKLGGLEAGTRHVVRADGSAVVRVVRGRRKVRCVYCGRSLDLGPA